jgi:uncharacterized integral membrane protein
MNQSPADPYQPLVIGLMIAFVLGSLFFILTGEFVRRRMIRWSKHREVAPAPPSERRG